MKTEQMGNNKWITEMKNGEKYYDPKKGETDVKCFSAYYGLGIQMLCAVYDLNDGDSNSSNDDKMMMSMTMIARNAMTMSNRIYSTE